MSSHISSNMVTLVAKFETMEVATISSFRKIETENLIGRDDELRMHGELYHRCIANIFYSLVAYEKQRLNYLRNDLILFPCIRAHFY